MTRPAGGGHGAACGIDQRLGTSGIVFLYGVQQVLDNHITLGQMLYAYGSGRCSCRPAVELP